jgi:hypothetical protein
MRSLLLGALVGLCALTACDEFPGHEGTRGSCASGGVLAGCEDAAATAEAACWRLVECGILPVDGAEDDSLDWGRCMDELDSYFPERRQAVVQCVTRATCDTLVPQPGRPWPYCFQFGDT